MMKRSITGLAIAAIAAFGVANDAQAGAGIEALTTVRVASGLDHVTFVTHAPGDYTRLYIVQKQGFISVLNLRTGVINPSLFLNIDSIVSGTNPGTNDERGLLGLAFDPDWQNNKRFYVNYTNNSGTTVVARYLANDGDSAIPTSASTVLSIAQPFTNHNGGWLGFSPIDGYLYIATGDGGAFDDPGNRAQDTTNQLLGKMLRIDVSGATGYTVPSDNPFVGVSGDDEIWAYGLRNPWRNSFDRDNGDLYIADVGQNAWEELNYEPAGTSGRNYGWRCREGMHNRIFSGTCGSQSFTEPYREYSHASGVSITGGYVYRGCAIPSLDGTYFFADYASRAIWTVPAEGPVGGLVLRTGELAPNVGSIATISSFGEDARGEIYIVDQGTGSSGEVFKIVPVTPTIADQDIDCNGAVDFNDLVMLLSVFGPCDGCLADFDGDGEVTFSDLVELLANWS